MDKVAVEQKWNKLWEERKTYKFDKNKADDKYYVLEMFSYPSGAKLHVGHWYNYGLSDSFARYKIMKGKNVFQPMGFDAFGLPAENYAIKNNIHPKIVTEQNINHFREQLKSIGFSFDWSRVVNTTDPNYYKWTQWIFIQLFKHGLAYKATMPINYCTSCRVGLANEEVVNGVCERCGRRGYPKRKKSVDA